VTDVIRDDDAPICKAVGMVLEIGEIEISPGAEEDFELAYRGVREVLAETPGCGSVRMTHSIETPSRYVLLVEWDSVEAHEQNFRGTDRFAKWRAAIGPFFARAPHVEHFDEI
jgi:heme-degrading monooxygenase HmoA